MGGTGYGRVLGDMESVDVREPSPRLADDAIITALVPDANAVDGESSAPPEHPRLARVLEAATGIAVAICLAISLVHVVLVFLYVAPRNTISQRYEKQINSWIYPLFEQNWKLFAPDPESVNWQISARTMRTSADGTIQVSDWFDLTAVDDSAVTHDFFPSHTTQNMLRRSWSAYLDAHGSDDQPHSERALMLQKYLRNIAVDRVAAYRHSTFDAIQLRVIMRPIAAPSTAAGPHPMTPATVDRYLPWWKVTSDGN